MSKRTQAEKVVELARTQKKFTTWNLIALGITQQNARIYDAREKFGCTHADRDALPGKVCTATEHIICTEDNHYEYVNDGESQKTPRIQPDESPTTSTLSEFDLKARIILVDAKLMVEKDPNKRRILELQKRGYQRALPNAFTKQVQEALVG